MANKVRRLFVIFLCSSLFLVNLSGCMEKPPIRIGLAAQLTGKQADLGIQLRNGVQLAVEEINANGGINGRNLDLLVEDDFGTAQGAKDAENKLIDAGVIAVIGHVTSDQTMAGYEIAEQRGILLISATASTSVMTGIDDLFFRTLPSTDTFGREFAVYIINSKQIDSIAILYDDDNKSYSEPFANSFVDTFISLGGKVTYLEKFNSSKSPDYVLPVKKMKDSSADAVFIIASPYDTALVVQTIRLQNWDPHLFISPWAQGEALFQTGGRTLDGIETIIGLDENSKAPEHLKYLNLITFINLERNRYSQLLKGTKPCCFWLRHWRKQKVSLKIWVTNLLRFKILLV